MRSSGRVTGGLLSLGLLLAPGFVMAQNTAPAVVHAPRLRAGHGARGGTNSVGRPATGPATP